VERFIYLRESTIYADVDPKLSVAAAAFSRSIVFVGRRVATNESGAIGADI